MPTIYKAPIWYKRPMLTEDEQETGAYSYTTLYDYQGKGQVSADGQPFDSATPGYARGKLTFTVDQGILAADWYDFTTDTCLVRLHPGVGAPRGWVVLTREEFIAAATEASENGAKPGVASIPYWWPEEEV